MQDSGADLFRSLRSFTAQDHRSLERELGLLRAPLSKGRMVRTLIKFLGFHRGWEPGIARHPQFERMFAGRGRIGLLELDLAALGLNHAEIAGARCCEAATMLSHSAAEAMGSLYVMEGSRLGGEVITRALASSDWIPRDGLAYFKPPECAPRTYWDALQEWARAAWPVSAWPAIERGAGNTFGVLRSWIKDNG